MLLELVCTLEWRGIPSQQTLLCWVAHIKDSASNACCHRGRSALGHAGIDDWHFSWEQPCWHALSGRFCTGQACWPVDHGGPTCAFFALERRHGGSHEEPQSGAALSPQLHLRSLHGAERRSGILADARTGGALWRQGPHAKMPRPGDPFVAFTSTAEPLIDPWLAHALLLLAGSFFGIFSSYAGCKDAVRDVACFDD